jgi:hypothetical protein
MVQADRAAVTIAGNRAGPSLYGAAPNRRSRWSPEAGPTAGDEICALA